MKHERPDIARLSPEKLSYIANKGLVKRVSKAIEQGDIPKLHIADDLTLTAVFADATTVTWPNSCGIYASQCTCPASTQVLCRHQLQTALCYRQYYCDNYYQNDWQNDNKNVNPSSTLLPDTLPDTVPHTLPDTLIDSPAHTITSQQVAAILKTSNSTSNQQAVKKLAKSGIEVMLSATAKDPCTMARLSMATVHFWGGSALNECTCDCQKKLGCEHIILAGIAFAKQQHPVTTPITVSVSIQDIKDCLQGKAFNTPQASAKNIIQTKPKPNDKPNHKPNHKDAPASANAANIDSTAKKESASAQQQTPDSLVPGAFSQQQLTDYLTVHFNNPSNNQPNNPSINQSASQSATTALLSALLNKLLDNVLNLLTDNERLLFTQFYRYGIGGGDTAIHTLVKDITQDNKKKQYLWLNDILHDLKDWLIAYRVRRSDFGLSAGNGLIAEYLLRRLAGQHGSLASASLGIGIKAQTDMRPTQLTGLGCQLQVYEGYYHAQTVLLDTKTQTPLILATTWPIPALDAQAQALQTAQPVNTMMQHYQQARDHRLTSKISLAALQHGLLTAQRSRRAANHHITLNKSRHAYNQLLPAAMTKQDLKALAAPLYFGSITQLRAYYKTRPLSFVRARHQQPNFVILPIAALLFMGYDPAEQTVGALIQASATLLEGIKPTDSKLDDSKIEDKQHDKHGLENSEDETPYWVKLTYRSHAPFALALLAETFAGMMPTGDKVDKDGDACDTDSTGIGNDKTTKNMPHHISGTLAWESFDDILMPVITPWAIFCEQGKVILALDLPDQQNHLTLTGHNPTANQTGKQTRNQTPSQSVNPADWQQSDALSKLPAVDFATGSTADTLKDDNLLHATLQQCQSWLDDALVYGVESLPNRFWYTHQQLMIATHQLGLKQLAASLNSLKPMTSHADSHIENDVDKSVTKHDATPIASASIFNASSSELFLMLAMQIALMQELAQLP